MEAKDLTLNIAVNLNRVARFSMEGRNARVHQFLSDTDPYVNQLRTAKKKPRFVPTYQRFIQEYARLKKSKNYNEGWAELALTWSNVLTHRAKLA